MTPDRRRQARAFWQAMTVFERRLMTEAGRARNALLRQAATKYTETGSVPAWLIEAHTQRVAETLSEHYRRVAPYFGELALQQVKSRRITRKSADPVQALIARWISREALRKARMIAATDRDDIADAIQGGMDDGLGVAEIARNIRRASSLTPARAAVIARTETHAAATFGSIESVRQAEQELGVTMLKVWLPTLDDRTRPDHAAMVNHQPIPMGEKFDVGGVAMDRPGDPSAAPEQVVNCRCALAYEEAP